jgi:hypothetical protein
MKGQGKRHNKVGNTTHESDPQYNMFLKATCKYLNWT